tara:strand:- start:336 stop:653 length:318 start_codon:yes stop_codon:yes gene_type:complete
LPELLLTLGLELLFLLTELFLTLGLELLETAFLEEEFSLLTTDLPDVLDVVFGFLYVLLAERFTVLPFVLEVTFLELTLLLLGVRATLLLDDTVLPDLDTLLDFL